MKYTRNAVAINDVCDGLDGEDGDSIHLRDLCNRRPLHFLNARLVGLHYFRIRGCAVQRVSGGHHTDLHAERRGEFQALRGLE